MENARNRIRELRKVAGITQEELGGRMRSELTGSTMAKLENGRQKLTIEYAQEIADVLGVSMFEVLGFDDVGVRVLPVLGLVQAGDWREAVEMTGQTQAVPASLRGPNLFVLRPQGDSMDQIVVDGGYVVIDPDQRDLIDGKVYVIANSESETTFKRYRQSPAMQLEPCSSNPEHQPIRIGAEPFVVIGRAIYAGQDL